MNLVTVLGLLSQEGSGDAFQQAINGYRLDFTQYLGNAIGAGIVIAAVALVIWFVGQISKWLKKSRR